MQRLHSGELDEEAPLVNVVHSLSVTNPLCLDPELETDGSRE